MNRKIEIRNVGGPRPWRLYWSGTDDLVDGETYATIEEAGPVARSIMEADLEESEGEALRRSS